MTSTESLCGALRLTDWGLIRAQGADAASFLHGQLTQDVASLPAGQARLAGFCSAKGRLLASFVLWRVDDQTIYLACSADLLAPTLKRLTMFVMRAKCKLSDASAEVSLYGQAPKHSVGQGLRHLQRLGTSQHWMRANWFACPMPRTSRGSCSRCQPRPLPPRCRF